MNDFYQKLVDLYAGEELPEELNDELEAAAAADPALSHDMFTLRRTVLALKAQEKPDFNDETHYRILLKMQQGGAEVQPQAPEPGHFQYHLPIQG